VVVGASATGGRFEPIAVRAALIAAASISRALYGKIAKKV
jgi:hypothetical protein